MELTAANETAERKLFDVYEVERMPAESRRVPAGFGGFRPSSTSSDTEARLLAAVSVAVPVKVVHVGAKDANGSGVRRTVS